VQLKISIQMRRGCAVTRGPYNALCKTC